jgi:hypothetical protein
MPLPKAQGECRMWLWRDREGSDRPGVGFDVCAGGTGGSEAVFRVIQRTNVEFDAGAEGTRRVQDVVEIELGAIVGT